MHVPRCFFLCVSVRFCVYALVHAPLSFCARALCAGKLSCWTSCSHPRFPDCTIPQPLLCSSPSSPPLPQLDLTGNHFTEEGLCALVDEGLGAQHYTRLAQGLDTEEGLYNATLQVLIMNLPGEQVFSPEFTEKLCDLQEYHPTLHDIWGSAPTQDTDGTRR